MSRSCGFGMIASDCDLTVVFQFSAKEQKMKEYRTLVISKTIIERQTWINTTVAIVLSREQAIRQVCAWKTIINTIKSTRFACIRFAVAVDKLNHGHIIETSLVNIAIGFQAIPGCTRVIWLEIFPVKKYCSISILDYKRGDVVHSRVAKDKKQIVFAGIIGYKDIRNIHFGLMD